MGRLWIQVGFRSDKAHRVTKQPSMLTNLAAIDLRASLLVHSLCANASNALDGTIWSVTTGFLEWDVDWIQII